jgi:DNA sulfur modification protein DndC
MKIDTEIEALRQSAMDLANEVKREIASRYQAPDTRPWIIAFSGGKDSTLMAQLVFEAVLSVPPRRRTRKIYVLSSDTQVETPQVVESVRTNVHLISESAASLGLPIEASIVVPETNDTFWVRIIGYGYPPPSRFMRWCTDRLKIRPSNKFILEKISEHGEVVILLGARYQESAARAKSLERHEGEGGFHRHSTLTKAYVWSPIRNFDVDQLWAYLAFSPSPWGGENADLRDLYKEAGAGSGECPLVVDETTEPCGNSRFGCYTCTVVERDRSLEGFVLGGQTKYQALLDLREWLIELRDDHDNRQTVRRNGQPGIGPVKMELRKQLLERVLQIQDDLGEGLISPDEVSLIKQAWLAETMDMPSAAQSA